MIIDSFHGKYFFLSNFYSHPVLFENIFYPTNEHAFQAAKTLNVETRKRIAACDTPGKAKALGRKVQLRPDWESIKYDIMHQIVLAKFDSQLKAKLLATGDAQLIEGNTWNDTIWGVCNGKGTNWLGKNLMDVRNELRSK